MPTLKANKGLDAGLLLLRVSVAVVLLLHGLFKLTHGIGWIEDMLRHIGLPGFLAYAVFLGEIVAPALLIVGVFGRLAGLVMAMDLSVAILLVQRAKLFTRGPAGGWGVELEGLILLVSLALALTGPGRYTLSRTARTAR
jgi:putative oxidoreductase